MSPQANSCLLILGDQLFPQSKVPLKKIDHILMIEDFALCSTYKYHKHKILFFLTSMRDYRDELEGKGKTVSYYDANHSLFKKTFFKKVDDFLLKNKMIKAFYTYQVSDHGFRKQLLDYFNKKKIILIELPTQAFLTTLDEFKSYLDAYKKPMMGNFYIRQRKRMDVLLEENRQPTGGKWSFDTENRKKYPKNIVLPEPISHQRSSNFIDVKKNVDEMFFEHPGSTENFWLATTRKQALKQLNDFLKYRLESFGPYEDAIHSENVFGFHTVISPYLNNGLLLPIEVIDKILEKGKEQNASLASIEGLVRQIMGWREFVKGIYDNYTDTMNSSNFWGHKRWLKDNWYEGSTGILPLDDSINKAKTYGYTHHIERLMILSNMMLLSEVDPKEVYRWFMEMYVDSADWVMEANVYGMGQMSDGGIFSTKPYICGSNYILKMSNYKKGDWCETVDGLYWRFVEKHQDFFLKNPRMSMMVRMLKKIPEERKKVISEKAESFIETMTQ